MISPTSGASIWCAMLVAVAVLLAMRGTGRRVDRRRSALAGGSKRSDAAAGKRVGLAQTLAMAIARLRGGGTVAQAFADAGMGSATGSSVRRAYEGRCEAVSALPVPSLGRAAEWRRLRRLLEQASLPDEPQWQVSRVASGVQAVLELSDELGCPAASCLDAVLASYRHMRLMRHLTDQALAVPKATVGLLSALPAITVALGELMGAEPLRFLLGSRQGTVCLVLGACCYAAGLAWIHALLRDLRP